MSDYSIAIKIGAQLEKNFSASIRAAQSGLAGLGGTSSQNMSAAGKMATVASKGLAVAGTVASAAAKAAAAAGRQIVAVGKYSVQVGKDFESAMSSASATANASAEDYAKMKQAAMEMGKTTSKTATESAQALEYMALAGWDVDTSVSALPSVLKMSEASGMDLAQTSDLVTDSMAALGVTVDELPGYLDVAAKAQTKSNQSAEQLMQAYLGVGGTMKNLNVPIEESAAALGVLANRGIKGAEGGNALNAIMVNLTTGTGQAGKMMQELGVSAFDSQGNFIGLEATLQQLNTALQGCSEEQRNAAMAAIGGKQHVDALNDLMAGLNTTNEEGVSEWAALTSELENCNGSLDAMRDTKLDNLEGDLAALQSATQDVGIKIYEHMNGPMREFAQFGTQAVCQVSDALESGGLTGMAGSIGDVVADGLAMIVSKAPKFLEMGLEMLYSFEQGLGKNASGIAQSLMSLIASAISTVIKNLPRHLMSLGSIAVGLVKGVMISIGNGIKQAIPQILTLVPVLFAKLLGAVIHAAPKLISAIPGVIKTAFGAILKLNPVSIGIRLMKAIIKGIISMGKNVLGAFKEAIFGGGDDKTDAEKAGAEAAQGYAEGAAADASGMAADTAATEGAAGAALPAAGLAGQAVDMPSDAADMAATTEISAVDAGKGTPDAGQTAADMPAEATQPADGTAAIAAPAPQETDILGMDASMAEAQAGAAPDMEGAVPAEALSTPGGDTEAIQAPIDAAGTPPDAMDAQDAGEAFAAPPDDIVPKAMQDMPPEAVQVSGAVMDASTEGIGTAADMPAGVAGLPVEVAPVEGTVADAPLEAAGLPADMMADLPPEAIPATDGAVADMPPEAAGIPSEAMTDAPAGAADIPSEAVQAETAGSVEVGRTFPKAADSGSMPEGIPQEETVQAGAGVVQALPAGIDAAGVGDGIDHAKDAAQSGMAGLLAGQTIGASGMDVNNAALSGKMGIAGALGGQSFMDGVKGNVVGGIDGPQVDVGAAGVDGTEAAQAAQTPPQAISQESMGEAPGGAAAETEAAQRTPPDAVGAPNAMPETQPAVTGIAAIISKIQEMIRPVAPMAGIPTLDGPDKGSVIGQALDKLSEKRAEQGASASGGSPTFTYSPTIIVKGSGDVKKDVEEANQLGMREFDKMMRRWMKQNARKAFT